MIAVSGQRQVQASARMARSAALRGQHPAAEAVKKLRLANDQETLLVDADQFKGEHFKLLRSVAMQNPSIPVCILSDRCKSQRDFLLKYCLRIGMSNVTVGN